jgi:hypothetical protein
MAAATTVPTTAAPAALSKCDIGDRQHESQGGEKRQHELL